MEKIRVGVVGTGFISDWVITGGRQDPRFEVVAICSRAQSTANQFANKHQIPYTFTSLEVMAASPLIDAVYIASPNYMHASQSILCMKHKKHVLCEKPLASNASEVREMIRVAKEEKVVLMEAMRTTLTPNFLSVRNHLKEIGAMRRYFASYCQYSSRYDKFKEGIVLNAFRPELSNGAIMDIGVYTIYPLIALFGRPDKIYADGVMLPSGVDGQGTAVFTYKGMNATIMYSKIADSFLPTEIQGENGTITLNRINIINKVTLTPHLPPSSGRGMRPDPLDISYQTEKDEYYYEVAEFINLIQSGKMESEINSLSCSLATIECIDEIRKQIGVVFPADKTRKL